MNPSNYSIDSAHKQLVLSKEVMIEGKWKLLVSQPYFKTQENGWKNPAGEWTQPTAAETVDCMQQDLPPAQSYLPTVHRPKMQPCLFDLRADPNEHINRAAANPAVVAAMWTALNITILGQRDCSGWSTYQGHGVPGPVQPGGVTSCSSPERIGICNQACADAHWETFKGNADGYVGVGWGGGAWCVYSRARCPLPLPACLPACPCLPATYLILCADLLLWCTQFAVIPVPIVQCQTARHQMHCTRAPATLPLHHETRRAA